MAPLVPSSQKSTRILPWGSSRTQRLPYPTCTLISWHSQGFRTWGGNGSTRGLLEGGVVCWFRGWGVGGRLGVVEQDGVLDLADELAEAGVVRAVLGVALQGQRGHLGLDGALREHREVSGTQCACG